MSDACTRQRVKEIRDMTGALSEENEERCEALESRTAIPKQTQTIGRKRKAVDEEQQSGKLQRSSPGMVKRHNEVPRWTGEASGEPTPSPLSVAFQVKPAPFMEKIVAISIRILMLRLPPIVLIPWFGFKINVYKVMAPGLVPSGNESIENDEFKDVEEYMMRYLKNNDVNKDTFFSKMFLCGDSVIIVLRNPKSKVIITALNALFVDIAGRKPLLLVSGGVGFVMGCLVAAISFYFKMSSDNRNAVGLVDFTTGQISVDGGNAGGSRLHRKNLIRYGSTSILFAKQQPAFAVGVAGFVTGIKLGSDSTGITYTSHRNMGITLFILGIIQVLAFFLRPKPDSKYRSYWNIYHRGCGYSMLILSIIQVYSGLDILDPEKKWKHTYTGILIALGVVTVLLEALSWFIFLKRKKEEKTHAGTNGGYGANEQV
ncbi:cytochrome b561 and DOMON domain-containing protein [Artemisia annua]|uniref:Cytochrome b561 and DOMON domain-containing protein n=1 Tax=Artemisia annua TaxID=35608 RepID=A0A2U1L3E6_ARTAN|nr:cytochrome b561 and DOMON domain-containing protein [Artemisia annua]